MERWEALRKLLDAARVALAALVGVVALVAADGHVLGLPPGVVAGATALVALAGQWGIRTKTTPHDDPDPSQVPELADTPEFEQAIGRGESEEPEEVADAEVVEEPPNAGGPVRDGEEFPPIH